MDEWIQEQRGLAGRLPRRYASIEDAFRRMQEENPHLSAEQARHLTAHGVNQNEDGTYSWKFDNYVRAWPPYDMAGRDIQALWARIACPTLLLYGTESRSGNPATDGRARHFQHATVTGIDRAGHWLHHDRLDEFLRIVRTFPREPPLTRSRSQSPWRSLPTRAGRIGPARALMASRRRRYSLQGSARSGPPSPKGPATASS